MALYNLDVLYEHVFTSFVACVGRFCDERDAIFNLAYALCRLDHTNPSFIRGGNIKQKSCCNHLKPDSSTVQAVKVSPMSTSLYYLTAFSFSS